MPFPNLRRAVVAMLAATLLIALSAASAGATIEPAPGGPILVVTNSADPHSTYYAEILRAEGLDEFATVDVSQLNAATLAGHDAVVLASAGVDGGQVQALTAWVQAGGNLVAMRPDAALAPLLGLTYVGGSDSDGYLTIDTSRPPGSGIVGSAIQYHGTADRYALAGARAVATLSSGTPAVTQRDLGAGHAAAFTYDLARSVIGTRQGNQGWAGQDHDGDGLTRPTDMFMSPTPGAGDWLNRAELQIPQADEQQRLLANLLTTATRTPLPRFWYLPRGDKAEVVLTGDDHGSGTTGNIWEQLQAKDPPGCSVADWQCVRATSYAYPGSPVPTNTHSVADFQALGFELALHLTISDSSCVNFSGLTQLNSLLAQQLNAFATTQGTAGAAAPTTIRTHCIAWSDWDSQPLADLAHGIRLNTDYYWYSANNWDQDLAGMFTGSGLPMRFTDAGGGLVDVYQAATYSADDATDSPNSVVPAQMKTLIDNALGANGYYGAFTVIVHNDGAQLNSTARDAVVAYAQSQGVSIISERQLLTWLDGRNASAFRGMSFAGGVLGFAIDQNADARGLMAMVPINGSTGALQGLTRDGVPVSYTTQVIKGVAYAFFPAAAGNYAAVYPPPPAAAAPRTTSRASRAIKAVTVLSRKTKAPTFPRLHLSAHTFRPGSGRSFAITLRLKRTCRMVLTFRNAKGKVVRRIRVPRHKAGTVLRLRWDGRDSRRRYVKAGRYRFTLTAIGARYRKTAKGSVRTLTAR